MESEKVASGVVGKGKSKVFRDERGEKKNYALLRRKSICSADQFINIFSVQ